MTTDTGYSAMPPSTARHHHHEWSAGPDDDRWRCACGAWISRLADQDGNTILLPRDRT